MSADGGTFIVYDGECPFCSRYVKLVRFRAAAGPVTLVNARDDHPIVRHVRSQGVVLNEQMALVLNGKVYAGAASIHRLALMSTANGPFNRMNVFLFSSSRISTLAYPMLRFGRKIALWLLRRPPIAD